MQKAVPGALVGGYEKLVDGLTLPDPDDRHVLAAAIRCGAAAIITSNLQDFPEGYLAEFEVEPIHPDDFVMDLASLEPQLVELTAKQQRESLNSPPLSAAEFVKVIEQTGLPQTAAFLKERADLI